MTRPDAGDSALLLCYARDYPDEFARILAARDDSPAAMALLANLPDDALRGVLSAMPQSPARAILDSQSDETLVRWLSEAPVAEAVRLAQRMGARRQAALREALPLRRRRALDAFRVFPPDCVGALAEREFSWVQADAPLAEAVAVLRGRRGSRHPPLVVVDAAERLLGFLDAERALACGAEGRVEDCVLQVRPLSAMAKAQAAASAPAWREWRWLPVVDDGRRPLGVLSYSRVASAQVEGSPPEDAPLLPALAKLMLQTLVALSGLLRKERTL